MMQLIDMNRPVILRVDENGQGLFAEREITIGKLLTGTLEDYENEVVDAVPEGWLLEYALAHPDDALAVVRAVTEWKKAQEAQRHADD